jgi:hypothetical protein
LFLFFSAVLRFELRAKALYHLSHDSGPYRQIFVVTFFFFFGGEVWKSGHLTKSLGQVFNYSQSSVFQELFAFICHSTGPEQTVVGLDGLD